MPVGYQIPGGSTGTIVTPLGGAGGGGSTSFAGQAPTAKIQAQNFGGGPVRFDTVLPTSPTGTMTPGTKTDMPSDIYSMYQNLLKDPASMASNPAYQFARDQGIEAATRKAASMGLRNSGNVLAELANLGTGLASQQFERFAGIYGQGAGTEANRWRMGQENELGFAGQDIQRYQAGNQAQSTVINDLLKKYGLDIQNMSEADRAKLQSMAQELEARKSGFTFGDQTGPVSGEPTSAAGPAPTGSASQDFWNQMRREQALRFAQPVQSAWASGFAPSIPSTGGGYRMW